MPMIKHAFTEFFTRSLPMMFLSLILFAGGIALLALRIPGWGLLLGLPAVQIGAVLLIFTFDEVVRSKIDPENFKIIPCTLCRKPILVRSEEEGEENICYECQQKLIKKAKSSHI